jgi:hypothetical protein
MDVELHALLTSALDGGEGELRRSDGMGTSSFDWAQPSRTFA